MVYDDIDPADIVAGKPGKEEIFQGIRNNQESFNQDIENLKQTSQFDIFNIKYSGSVNEYSQTELDSLAPTFKAPVSLTITSFVMTLLEASTSGTLEVDLEKSTDNGANWVSMLNSPVQLTGDTVGSISGSVDWDTQSVSQGNLLRIKITGIQVDQGAFHISIYGELA